MTAAAAAGSSLALARHAPRWGLVALIGTSCALPSLADFSSGPSTAIAPDGAANDADATAQPPTNGADAGPDADVRCSAGHVFCDDFEDDPLDRLWGGGRQSGGTLGTGPGTSGRGLVAEVPQHDGEARLEASLEKQLDFSARQPFSVSFDAKLSVVVTGGVLDLDLARYYEGRFYNVAIRFGSNGAVYLHEYGDPIGGSGAVGDNHPVAAIAAGTWTRIAFVMTFVGTAAKGKLSFDGVTVFDGPLLAGPYATASPRVVAGIANTEHSGAAATVSVDRFVVTSP